MPPRSTAQSRHGWITELQARDDGIWGRVEWNASGHSAMDNKSYRGVSPVFDHDAQGKRDADQARCPDQ
ncbi:phage protease [Komagataeibacter kakiaceti]